MTFHLIFKLKELEKDKSWGEKEDPATHFGVAQEVI